MTKTKRPLFMELANLIGAIENCEQSNNYDWMDKHTEKVISLSENNLPHGSGFDSGSMVDIVNSTSEKIVIDTSFHHMDEHGGYDGWTNHTIIITPSLKFGYTLDITGEDKNGIKEYMYDTFNQCLSEMVE